MTKDQVNLIKEAVLKDDGTGNPLAYTLSVLFNNEVTFRNTDDFVIWDDDNELVHAIKINMDGPRQSAQAPYRIATGFFGNIQFLEGLYTMANFGKAIDELFVKTGLISEEKKAMLMTWANGIRNNMSMPSNPGPYFPTGPMIPPGIPKPDVRPGDGIFHGAPIDQRTKENKIISKVTPVVEENGFVFVRPLTYKMNFTDPAKVAAAFKKMITAIPEKDLFWASVGNGKMYVEYNPKITHTVEKFEETAIQLLPNVKGATSHIDLNIEAYGVRVKYCFILTIVNDDVSTEAWITNTVGQVSASLNSLAAEEVTAIRVSGFTISATISNPDTDLGLTDLVQGLAGLQRATFKYKGKVYTWVPGGDTTQFTKGVISAMPENNNQTTNSELNLKSANGANLTYKLNVKYVNEDTITCEVGGKSYDTLAAAVANAPAGATIKLVNDMEITSMVAIKKQLNIDLDGHTISTTGEHMLVFTDLGYEDVCEISNGNLVNNGENARTTVLAQKASVKMTDVIINSTSTFGAEAGVSADGYWGCLELINCNITAKNAVGVYGPNRAAADQYNHPTTKVVIDGDCVLNGTESYGIVCNGSAHNTDIEIMDGASITGGALGIYHPQDGKLVVGAVDITAGETGIEIRGGDVTINGAHIVSTADDSAVESNDNGTTAIGIAIAISQHITKLPISVELNNVIANGQYGFYESNPENNPAEDIAKVTATITGGTFTGKVAAIYAEDLTGFVMAGTSVSTEPDAKYLYPGLVATDTGDGTWNVVERSADAIAEDTIDAIIEGIDAQGVVVVPTEENNVYNITTSTGTISDTGMFDEIASMSNLTKITITDGENEDVVYEAGGDLEAFKTAVDNLIPKANEDEEVTLTMTVEIA